MWPNSRFADNNNRINNININANNRNPNEEPLNQRPESLNYNENIANRMSSMDSNQLLLTANSIRSLLGNNISNNLLQSISAMNKMSEKDINESNVNMSSRRVLDYESDHYSRLPQNWMNRLSPNSGLRRINENNESDMSSAHSSSLITDKRFFDPTKMPQKSILKKSKDQINRSPSAVANSSFHNAEDEDNFLYGGTSSVSVSNSLPPGIIELDQRNAQNVERVLSPISLRLKREMETIDWAHRRQSPIKQSTDWPQTHDMRQMRSTEEPMPSTNSWIEEEERFKLRARQFINLSPSPPKRFDDLLNNELQTKRYLQMKHNFNVQTKARSPQTRSPTNQREIYRAKSFRKSISPQRPPHLNSIRSRKRSPSYSPRRRSISPRYKLCRSRSRSSSPGRSIRRYRRSRSRSRSRSDSRSRSRRRSRTPERSKSPFKLRDSERIEMNRSDPDLTLPMGQTLPFGSQNFMAPFGPRHAFVGPQMYYAGPPMMPYPQMMTSNVRPNVIPQTFPPQQQIRAEFNLKTIPLTKTAVFETAVNKKENKLINPRDLLIAERSKLREQLNAFKKQLERKVDEQKAIQLKDGGKDSYAFKLLEKMINQIKTNIEESHTKLETNGKAIHEVEKSKAKEKETIRKAKLKTTANLYDSKKKQIGVNCDPKQEGIQVNKIEVLPKDKIKQIVDDEDDENTSRFNYFDSGPHWCRNCNKFFSTMKFYFEHIHSSEHLNQQKECERTPWKTKEFYKHKETKTIRNKEQLIVASKGIQFIHPTQGFYCELCEQILVDINQVEFHFKSAKHNRRYTRYTLLHNNYESKWKSDRDKAFTQFKRLEREEEKERNKRELEDRAYKRSKLEEEVKRKDKEVKQKIEAMNKNLKVVKELDEVKDSSGETKNDENNTTKGIRLNLSNNKNESENKSSDKSKKDKNDKKTDKRDKQESNDTSENENKHKDVSKSKCKQKSGSKPIEEHKKDEIGSKSSEKLNQMTPYSSEEHFKHNKTPIDGMECIIIDEIDCNTSEELNSSVNLIIDETVGENSDQNISNEMSNSMKNKREDNQNEEDSNHKQICDHFSKEDKDLVTKSKQKDIISNDISTNVEILESFCDNKNLEPNDCKTGETVLKTNEIKDKEENVSPIIEISGNKMADDIESNIDLKTEKYRSESNDRLIEKVSEKTAEENEIKSSDEKVEDSIVSENCDKKSTEKTEMNSITNEEQNEDLVNMNEKDVNMNESENYEMSKSLNQSIHQNKQMENKSDTNSKENEKLANSQSNESKKEEKTCEIKEDIIESMDTEFEDELEGFDVIDSINDETVTEDKAIEIIDLSDN